MDDKGEVFINQEDYDPLTVLALGEYKYLQEDYQNIVGGPYLFSAVVSRRVCNFLNKYWDFETGWEYDIEKSPKLFVRYELLFRFREEGFSEEELIRIAKNLEVFTQEVDIDQKKVVITLFEKKYEVLCFGELFCEYKGDVKKFIKNHFDDMKKVVEQKINGG